LVLVTRFWYMEQSLCNVTVSVRMSVPFASCSSVRRVCCCGPRGRRYRSIAARPAPQQHGAARSAARCAAANDAGSVTFTADVGSWTQTCFITARLWHLFGFELKISTNRKAFCIFLLAIRRLSAGPWDFASGNAQSPVCLLQAYLFFTCKPTQVRLDRVLGVGAGLALAYYQWPAGQRARDQLSSSTSVGTR